MNTGRTVFSQLTDFFPLAEFRRCVERYRATTRSRAEASLYKILQILTFSRKCPSCRPWKGPAMNFFHPTSLTN